MAKSLKLMQEEVYQNNRAKGWFDSNRTVGDDVALLHEEVTEMFHAYRLNGTADMTDTRQGINEVPKPEGFGSEAADILIRLLDTCERHGIELEWEYERKMTYNRTRPYRHGNRKV